MGRMTSSARYYRQFDWRKQLLWLLFWPCFSYAQPALDSSTIERSQSFLHNLSGVDLIDQTGQSFSPDKLTHHIVLFNFIFTQCASTCSLQTHVLAQVMQALPADVRRQVRFVSVSVDPENDTPVKLRAFAQQMHADLDGWFFLTGDTQQIEQLTRRLHVFGANGADNEISPPLHRTTLWLVDGQGRMLQRYQGDPPDKDRLVRELSQVSRMAASL